MGKLNNDMTRLRGEIEALRKARGALKQELARGAGDLSATVAAMRADLTAAHMAMVKKTGEERRAFVTAVTGEVNSLLGVFSRDRDDMARKGRHDRGAFLTEMRKQVAGMRKEAADDLIGARLAWRGQSPRKSRSVQPKKEQVFIAPSPSRPISTLPISVQPKKEQVFIAPGPPPAEETLLKKTVAAAHEFEEERPPVTFGEPLKEEEKATAAMPKDPAVEPPKVKTQAPVFASVEIPKQKEKRWPDEKPAKTTTKGKRGKIQR